jgi:hypothetical protein
MTYRVLSCSVSSTCYCSCWVRRFHWVMDVSSPYYCCCHHFGWVMGMRCVAMHLELAAAAAAAVVMAPCGRTVAAGVAALPCDMVVVVAVHIVSSEKNK